MIFFLKDSPISSVVILTIITFLLCGYFISQIFQGEYSVLNLQTKQIHLDNLISQYEKNNMDKDFYEKRIKSLSADNLDIDLLEEEMRKKMILTKPNELILITPDLN